MLLKNILNRFDSAGMSLGALSPKAHETLAEAMNHLGARSNSGEGGEDKSRYGTSKMSKIKQLKVHKMRQLKLSNNKHKKCKIESNKNRFQYFNL